MARCWCCSDAPASALSGQARWVARGVRIRTGDSYEGALGTTVAGAGDVNGDGLDDLVLTDPRGRGAERPINRRSVLSLDGAAYVVYGRRSAGTIDLGHLGRRGFAVRGIEEGSAAGAGDVNGDGYSDIVIGADDQQDGGAYVVYGGPRRRSFDAYRLGRRGLLVRGAPRRPVPWRRGGRGRCER